MMPEMPERAALVAALLTPEMPERAALVAALLMPGCRGCRRRRRCGPRGGRRHWPR